ncbi:hypothetical protein RKE29_01420 [Streptomyces sp. B1866]|uniref:hypothetical protein n=1 Tax=Streptomyces sp. B1866 TaxID=3075431 RepID=UPI00288D0EF4|nr:hypothetical protein [Streptomyces sp. B1866]MDT3395320.1 hypothetical protein [Streptomyces sp. B1866]
MSSPAVPDPRFGTRTLTAALGLDSAEELLARHPADSVPGVLARLLVHAALTTDDLDERLGRAAASAAEDLRRFTGGRHSDLHALPRLAASDVDILAARRSQATDHLRRLLTTYQNALITADGNSPAPVRAEELAPRQVAARHSRAVRLSAAQVAALEEIARGGVALQEIRVGRGRFVVSPRGARLYPATVDALVDKGLADRDRSTSLFRGQRLALTEQGERALAEHRRRTPARAEAARARTTTPTSTLPPSALAPAPQPTPAGPPAHVPPHRKPRS